MMYVDFLFTVCLPGETKAVQAKEMHQRLIGICCNKLSFN